jgi:hypothetical protein
MQLEEGETIDLGLVNDYHTKYVVFLDLLGFSALVERCGIDIVERHRLVESLKLVRDTLRENSTIGLRFKYFSDCIMISANHTAHALWELFHSVRILTMNLLQYDILVRGGLAVGPTHHSDDFIFGTAVTEAYKLESDGFNGADGPLVLLSPDVVREVQGLGPDFQQWLRQDGDGRYFIHYLIEYAAYTTGNHVGKVTLTYPAERIAYFIGQRLEKDRGRVRQKAEWFQRYWNQEVASQGVLPRIDAGSQATLPPHSITIIMRRPVAPADLGEIRKLVPPIP